MTLIFVLLAGLSLSAGDKKKQQAFYVKPGQTADLQSQKLVTARQNCEDWALAAGLEMLLLKQNVRLDQTFWVMKLLGGELCRPESSSMDAWARVVNNRYVLDDGRHVELQMHFQPGAPRVTDPMIFALRQEQLVLVLWHAHPYYLTGATYDEYIGRDGTRRFQIKELRLADTYGGKPALTFEPGKDDPDEIEGLVTIKVTELIDYPH